MADKNFVIQERNPQNTGWDKLFPETTAHVVKMGDGISVEAKMATKADVSNTATLRSNSASADDPNLTILPLILSSHANCPDTNFWYIETRFYSNTENCTQRAQSYIGPPKLYTRSRYDGVWQPWTEFVGAVGKRLTSAFSAQINNLYTTAQLRNVILSPNNPSAGELGDIWIKYK